MNDMTEVQIIFDYEDDSVEVAELNEWKGYRHDVKLVKRGKKYELTFYRGSSLVYQINRWEETKPWDFIMEGYIILQDELDNESIRKRVHELIAAGYFK